MGVTLSQLVASWYPGVVVPMWVETALWQGYAWLYGPGGRQRLSLEVSALRLRVHTVMGGRGRLGEHELFPFPTKELEVGHLSLEERKRRDAEKRAAKLLSAIKMWAIAVGPRVKKDKGERKAANGKPSS